MTRDTGALVPATSPFGSSLPAPLACYGVTTFIESSPGLTIPSTLAPLRLGADSYTVASRFRCPSCDCGYIVRGHYMVSYLTTSPLRVLLMGQQVLSRFHGNSANATALQPIGQKQEVLGEGAKAAHWLRVLLCGHCPVDRGGADVNARGIGVECWGGRS